MGFLLLKKITLLCLLVSACMVSTSFAETSEFAGRKSSFLDAHATNIGKKTVEAPAKLSPHGKSSRASERMLKVHTKDYGSYDPAPTFVKPPFKLIPN
ncbi:protein CASPARIAN STRIP INTEGRITY FACTOR 1-like [Aristolochia californica]|uniref:protein CASPARIAN STRIP INTEGRITY FACTOR 1-like n=1 Tax=Aristolochia californica TaxID=171875 RepID=UPI0035DA4478